MALKDKIKETVDGMSESELQSAWLIIKEIVNQKMVMPLEFDKTEINRKIDIGLKQLENGEGRDLDVFLNEMEVKYGKK